MVDCACFSETEVKQTFERLRSLLQDELANINNVPRPQTSSSEYVQLIVEYFSYFLGLLHDSSLLHFHAGRHNVD